jgi:hypothetical protein
MSSAVTESVVGCRRSMSGGVGEGGRGRLRELVGFPLSCSSCSFCSQAICSFFGEGCLLFGWLLGGKSGRGIE